MKSADPVLYAVADGEQARFLKFDGQQLRTTKRLNAAGRGVDGESADAEVGSIKSPRKDPHEQIKALFAREVAEAINSDMGSLDGLVLAAAPHVLHDIREHLTKSVVKKLIKSEAKDLINIPDHDLLGHFSRPASGWPEIASL